MKSALVLAILFATFLTICEVKAKRGNIGKDQQISPIIPESRIVGGRNARDGQFPYQISLRLGGQHICGGSIISNKYVVTAVHCITITKATADRLSIRAGSISKDKGGQTIGVSSVKLHPSYEWPNNDVALLQLSAPLQFNDRVKPIALAKKAPPSGAQVIVSGWGFLRTNGNTPEILQYNTLKALSYDECRQRKSSLKPSVLCLAHTQGNGVCTGDSGGPAVYDNQLVGVASYVIDGCGSNNPDGFANIAVQYDWIKSNSN